MSCAPSTELRLAGGLRELLTGAPPAKGVAIGAVTRGAKISSHLVIPRPKQSLVQVGPWK